MAFKLIRAAGVLIVCSMFVLACQPVTAKKGQPNVDISGRSQDASIVASAVLKSVMSLDEFEAGLVSILINRKALEQRFGPVVVHEGVLGFKYNGHQYDVHFSALGDCVQLALGSDDTLMITVKRESKQPGVDREFLSIDSGDYTLWIIEDHLISWW